MRPLAYCRTGGRAGFEYERGEATAREVGGGGQTGGAGSDHDDGQLHGGRVHGDSLFVSTFVDGLYGSAWHLIR